MWHINYSKTHKKMLSLIMVNRDRERESDGRERVERDKRGFGGEH